MLPLTVAEYESPFHDILKFTDMTGPVMGYRQRCAPGVNPVRFFC